MVNRSVTVCLDQNVFQGQFYWVRIVAATWRCSGSGVLVCWARIKLFMQLNLERRDYVPDASANDY